MNDHIILEMNEDGGYVVDIIGLVYLLKKKLIPENSEVLSILESGYEVNYVVCEEAGSYFLMVDEAEFDEQDFEEDDYLSAYFEIDEDAMAATYYIDTAIAEDGAGQNFEPLNKVHYQNVHYEEALTRMKNNETVYLDYEDYDMKEIDSRAPLSPGMVMDGLWFVSEETKGIKHTNTKKETANKNLWAEAEKSQPKDELSLLLENYFAQHERSVIKSPPTPIPQKKKDTKKVISEEDFLDTLLGMGLMSFLMGEDFDGDSLDYDDYI